MRYIMQNQHETIIYSMNNIFKLNERPLQFLFKAVITEINQTK